MPDEEQTEGKCRPISQKQQRKLAKDARLKQALRANLRRRKEMPDRETDGQPE
jgi:hypothetical protein